MESNEQVPIKRIKGIPFLNQCIKFEVTPMSHKILKSENEAKTVGELKAKPVYYLVADKGKKVVILDIKEYDSRIQDKTSNGPYRKLRHDPLPDWIKKVEKAINESKQVLGSVFKYLKV